MVAGDFNARLRCRRAGDEDFVGAHIFAQQAGRVQRCSEGVIELAAIPRICKGNQADCFQHMVQKIGQISGHVQEHKGRGKGVPCDRRKYDTLDYVLIKSKWNMH